MNSIESQRNLQPTAANELADTLERLLLDSAEGYNTMSLVQDGLAAIHHYRIRTGTQRVRQAAANAQESASANTRTTFLQPTNVALVVRD